MAGIFRTLGRVFAGFLLACIAAGLVQVLFVDTPRQLASVPASDLAGHAGTTLELTLLTATHFAIFSSAFALIAAGIAEWLGLRSPSYWLAAGTAIALLGFIAQYASEVGGQPSILNNYALQAYLTAGFFGGLVYWLVAGVHSGEVHGQPQLATISEAPRPRIIVEKAPRGSLKMGSLAEKLALRRKSKDEAAGADTPAAAEVTIAQPPPSPQSSPQTPQSPAPAPPPAAKATAVPVTKGEPPKAKAASANIEPRQAPADPSSQKT